MLGVDAGIGVDGAFTPVGAGAVCGVSAFSAGAITVNLCRCRNFPHIINTMGGVGFI